MDQRDVFAIVIGLAAIGAGLVTLFYYGARYLFRVRSVHAGDVAALGQLRGEIAAAGQAAGAALDRRACPTCGSRSENWKPERDYCADCGRGVRVGSDAAGLLHMLDSGTIDEQTFVAMGIASGFTVRQLASMLDQREQLQEQGGSPEATDSPRPFDR